MLTSCGGGIYLFIIYHMTAPPSTVPNVVILNCASKYKFENITFGTPYTVQELYNQDRSLDDFDMMKAGAI